MLIPSPDAALIAGADRIAAIPQRKGVPLPLLLIPLPFIEAVGLAMIASLMLALSTEGPPTTLGMVFLGMAAIDAAIATKRGRRLLADASSWSPEKAMRYRAEALEARETITFFRSFKAVIGIASLVILLCTLLRGERMIVLVIVVAFATCSVGRMLQAYGDCVMPVDPDLRQRARVPAGA